MPTPRGKTAPAIVAPPKRGQRVGYQDAHVQGSGDASTAFGDGTFDTQVSPKDFRKRYGALPLGFMLHKLFVYPYKAVVQREGLRADSAYNAGLRNTQINITHTGRLLSLLVLGSDARLTYKRNGLRHQRLRSTTTAVALVVAAGVGLNINSAVQAGGKQGSEGIPANILPGGNSQGGVIGVDGVSPKKQTRKTIFELSGGKISCASTIALGVEEADVATPDTSPLLTKMSAVAN